MFLKHHHFNWGGAATPPFKLKMEKPKQLNECCELTFAGKTCPKCNTPIKQEANNG